MHTPRTTEAADAKTDIDCRSIRPLSRSVNGREFTLQSGDDPQCPRTPRERLRLKPIGQAKCRVPEERMGSHRHPPVASRPCLTAYRHTSLVHSRAARENRRMRTLRTGAAVVLIAGLHSLAAQSPMSKWGTATAAPRTGHALGFYDGRLRRVVLVGAPGDPKDGDRDSVWIWTGATWEPVTDAGPPGRVNAGGAYGARRGRAVVAGGSRKAADGATWEVVGDAWEGDQSGWRRVDFGLAAQSPRAGGRRPRRRADVWKDPRRSFWSVADGYLGSCGTTGGRASRATARPDAAGRRSFTTANASSLSCSAAWVRHRDRISRRPSSATPGRGTGHTGRRWLTADRPDDTRTGWSSTKARVSSCSMAAPRPIAMPR